MSIRLYVGNLPRESARQELEAFFTGELGDFASTKVVTDRKTGKCRGFGFITVETSEQADEVIEKLNGQVFQDSVLKIEKALPKSNAQEESSAPSSSENESTPVVRRGAKGQSPRPSATTTTTQPEATQPDPRWAQELEKLKQMLNTQASNS